MATYTQTLTPQGNKQVYQGYYQFGPTTSTTAYASYSWKQYTNVYFTGLSFEVYCNESTKWDKDFRFKIQWQFSGSQSLSQRDFITNFEYSDMTKNGSYRYKCTLTSAQFGYPQGWNQSAGPIIQNTTLTLYWMTSAYAIASEAAALHLSDVSITFSGDEVIDDGTLKVVSSGRTLYVVGSYTPISVTPSTSGTYYMRYSDYKQHFGFLWGAGDYVAVTLPDYYVAGVTYYTSSNKPLMKA